MGDAAVSGTNKNLSEHTIYYDVYEVFSQKEITGKFESQFSLLAPNPEIALMMAQENFMRREETPVNLFVVKRSDIHYIPAEQRKALKRMDNKAYRMPGYYGRVLKKWKELRAQRGVMVNSAEEEQ